MHCSVFVTSFEMYLDETKNTWAALIKCLFVISIVCGGGVLVVIRVHQDQSEACTSVRCIGG